MLMLAKRRSFPRFFFFCCVLSLSAISANKYPETTNRILAALIPAVKTDKSAPFKNWGITNHSKKKSHIFALDAWKLEKGSRGVVVAVIDTGIDPNHKDLKANLWKKANHPKSNYGWDYVTNAPNPGDSHGHGTHVSGIIGATSNSRTGITGVAPRVSIMPIRYYSDSNSGTTNLNNTIKALHYAIDNGAQIINYSGGGPEFNQKEYLAIKRAEARGILVVAAAGNGDGIRGMNTDLSKNRYFPAAYGLSNIITVASTDINNNILKSSNYGKRSVDVAAPGENIFSTLPKNKYGYMTGTSQATAFVSGLAALLLSKNKNLKPAQIKKVIQSTVDTIPNLAGKVATSGKINAYKALKYLMDAGKTVPGAKLGVMTADPTQLFRAVASPSH